MQNGTPVNIELLVEGNNEEPRPIVWEQTAHMIYQADGDKVICFLNEPKYGKLIAAAPQMLFYIEEYLRTLQEFANDGDVPFKIAFDEAEANLLKIIAFAKGE